MEQLELRQISTDLEIRKEGDQKRITGYAVKWDKYSNPIFFFKEKFIKGAFKKSLEGGDIRALWQHDTAQVLGRTKNKTLKLKEDDKGLWYEIIPPSWAFGILETIERGDVTESSFGFRMKKEQWDDTDPKLPIRTIIEAELVEVSPVTFAAYPQSKIGVRNMHAVYDEHMKKEEELKHRKKNKFDMIMRNHDLIIKL